MTQALRPHHRGRAGRAGRLAVTVGVVAASALIGGAVPAAAAARQQIGPGSVTLTVLSVSPASPIPSTAQNMLTVEFRIRNNTSTDLPAVTITGTRALPITDQTDLNDEIAHPTDPPDPTFKADIAATATPFDVPAGDTVSQVFTTTTSISRGAGICQCANAIYPLFFTASTVVDGASVVLGTAQTYIPAFDETRVGPVDVGWVWPLLDTPHRLTGSNVFLDDDLAAEVAPGGRLDRDLTVLESVAPTVPMTVVTDPDLLDELEVMAAGPYQVEKTVQSTAGPTTTLVAGTGTADASDWLARLATVLTENPTTSVELTAPGDPDVEGLTAARMSWSSTLDPTVLAHVTAALGGRPADSTVSWPLNSTASASTLATLAHDGTTTVILSNATLPKSPATELGHDALASVSTSGGRVTVGVTSASIEKWADAVLSPTESGAHDLPELVAQVALHALSPSDSTTTESHFVLITAPRDLDVDPDVAEQAILDTADPTATGGWAKPVTLEQAAATIDPSATSTVAVQRGSTLPASTVAALNTVRHALPGLSTMFTDADRTTELAALPLASQRAANSLLVSDVSAADSYALQLDDTVQALRSGVYLRKPASGNYTLTSTHSSIPITITNDLAVPVLVDVYANTVGGLPGFTATPVSDHTIAARTTVQLKLPTQFDRTGRIQVQVNLSSPSGLALGQPILLSVRSTALGTIGVVITVVAGAILALALILRAVGRVRRIRRKRARAIA